MPKQVDFRTAIKALGSVNTGGVRWSLQVKAPEDLRGNAGATWGITQSRDLTLKIDEGLADDRLLEVVIHELLHAVLYQYHQSWSDKAEEAIVSNLATGLIDAIDRNPALIQAIITEVHRHARSTQGTAGRRQGRAGHPRAQVFDVSRNRPRKRRRRSGTSRQGRGAR